MFFVCVVFDHKLILLFLGNKFDIETDECGLTPTRIDIYLLLNWTEIEDRIKSKIGPKPVQGQYLSSAVRFKHCHHSIKKGTICFSQIPVQEQYLFSSLRQHCHHSIKICFFININFENICPVHHSIKIWQTSTICFLQISVNWQIWVLCETVIILSGF